MEILMIFMVYSPGTLEKQEPGIVGDNENKI